MQKISLPIDLHLDEIADKLKNHDNLVLTAPPGSGKTTRVPPFLLKNYKKIVVLVPRRIAAVSTASRICDENDFTLGDITGYQVRFENKSARHTRLIFMTEGVFIKKINDAEMWRDLELIVFDEFHERSSQMDMALGICLEKQILGQNIKLLVMSATLGVEKIKNYLGHSAHVDVLTEPYPLQIIYSKKSQRLLCDFLFAEHLIEILQTAATQSKKDILIFLPGLSEIRFIERLITAKFKSFEIHILHGSIKLEEQKKILAASVKRRIILSTNIAESSITIPSVDCVIDSGLEKKSASESKIGFKRLELNRISLFSARQRAGRAARTGPGRCYRLWHELDERSMPEQIIPEIIKSDLLEESLTLLSVGVVQPDSFSWLDKPQKKFTEAFEQLFKWNLIDPQFNITSTGIEVQSCPLDVERSLMFVELARAGCKNAAADFMAFLETTNFDKQIDAIDIQNLHLNDLGSIIAAQLNRLKVNPIKPTGDLRDQLILIFFRDFPHRIAKRKDKHMAVSSLGRGVELSPYLTGADTDYFILLSGRDQSNSLTKCDFAIPFSSEEFEKYSAESIEQVTQISYDTEKRKLFKVDRKMAGYFVVSESAKTYLNEKENAIHFDDYLKNNLIDLLSSHGDYKDYITKMSFLRKKSVELGLNDNHFDFFENLNSDVLSSLAGSVTSPDDFFNLALFDILLFATPETLRLLLKKLPRQFTLPNGKQLTIDYESEQAPKISARLQDFFRQNTNPTVLDGKIRMTIELLAPNYRPTQVTSQLEKFWSTSYLEIRKELKARYPRHAWPEDPTNFVIPPKK
jgi:ATP-dependent helicase HrpB